MFDIWEHAYYLPSSTDPFQRLARVKDARKGPLRSCRGPALPSLTPQPSDSFVSELTRQNTSLETKGRR